VVGFGKEINAYRISIKKYEEKYCLETTDADGRIILKWFLKVRLKIGPSASSMK